MKKILWFTLHASELKVFYYSFTINRLSAPGFQLLHSKQILSIAIRKYFVAIKPSFVDVEQTLELDLVS